MVSMTGTGGDEVFSGDGIRDDSDDVFLGDDAFTYDDESDGDADAFSIDDGGNGGDDVFSGNDERNAVSGTDDTFALFTDNDGESSRIDGDDDVSLSSNSETTPRTELPTAFRHWICN